MRESWADLNSAIVRKGRRRTASREGMFTIGDKRSRGATGDRTVAWERSRGAMGDRTVARERSRGATGDRTVARERSRGAMGDRIVARERSRGATFRATAHKDLETSSEILWCEIHMGSVWCALFGVYYRPPSTGGD